MKRRILITCVIALLTTFSISNTYGGWGVEEWTNQVITIACSYSGTQNISLGGSFGTGDISFTGGATETSTITYAHYQGQVKNCDGWVGKCYGDGRTRITSFQPIIGCPNR